MTAAAIIASGDVSANSALLGLTSDRVETANSAADEIYLLSMAMQKFIEREDDCGQIHPVTRGMCLRMVSLAQAISAALDASNDEQEAPRETVYCKDMAAIARRA